MEPAIFVEYGLGWMNLRAGRWEDAKTHMQRALARANAPNTRPLSCRQPGFSCAVPWGYFVIAKAAQQLGDSALLCRTVADALAADSGSRWARRTRCERSAHAAAPRND